MSWAEFEQDAPDLATFGRERFTSQVAYLATVKKDGAPRVHPVTPIVGGGHLFVFMEPTSPKGHDLRRDGRFALHCSVRDSSGESGEFLVSGRAELSDSAELRSVATTHAPYAPADRYFLFELHPERAFSTEYPDGGEPVRRRWKNPRDL
jgi:hypothetical protein